MVTTRDRNNWWTIILALIGGSIGVAVMVLGNEPPDPKYREFNDKPEFMVWIILIGFQTSLWSVFALTVWEELRSMAPFQRENILQLFILLVATLAITGVIIVIRPTVRPLKWHEARMGSLQLLGMSVGLLAMHGIWLIHRKLDVIWKEMDTRQDYAVSIQSLLALRTKLEKFLFAAGTIIGAATLATGALRQALIAIGLRDALPGQYILLYGVIYSVFLALIYWPVHVKFQSVGIGVRNRLVPLPKTENMSWAQWNGERKALDDLLQLQTNPLTSLYGSISILSPLVGSLIALLLGGKS